MVSPSPRRFLKAVNLDFFTHSPFAGKSDQTEKTLRVGVITYTQDDPFINGLTDELKEQLKAMENKERRIIVSTKSGNDDQQEQNEKVMCSVSILWTGQLRPGSSEWQGMKTFL